MWWQLHLSVSISEVLNPILEALNENVLFLVLAENISDESSLQRNIVLSAR